jgi:CubicO group peptidase (beta-lactamase class C family)
LTQAVQDSAFPSAQIVVWKDGVIVFDHSYGNLTYDTLSREIDIATLFDLASLTKVVATTTAIMRLYDQKRILLDDRVTKFIPQFAEGKKSEVTIRHLLTHTSGLPPFRQLWKVVPDSKVAVDSVYATNLVASPGDTTMYSDLGFIVLGKIVEKSVSQSLDEFMTRHFFNPFGMRETMFLPAVKNHWTMDAFVPIRDAKWMSPNVAPTEIDSVLRKRLVWGRVHDENAEFLGGVSGHAGLFSTAGDLAIFMHMLMNGGTYNGVRYMNSSTIELFTKKQSEKSSRALGWDTKSPIGSSAGRLFSPTSFGHTGFTGTSIWADPEKNLFVILLTNRVHPTRANSKIAKVRPAVHDAVIEALKQSLQ